MRSISGELTEPLARWTQAHGGSMSSAPAFPVSSFSSLVQHVAGLAYLNKDHMLFFRGQPRDYRNKAGASTLYPTIYRGERLARESVELAFDVLDSTAARLCDALQDQGIVTHADVRRRKYIQWSILQHYRVCATPLLDVTHSLLVACSFAFLDAADDDPYLYVLGLPYVANRVSINSEHDLVNVRLLSICPPEALRPYYQEGYVVGTDEITSQYVNKTELDFSNRLIAKFQLAQGRRFWAGGFKELPHVALYPPNDPVEDVCARLGEETDLRAPDGRVGAFLREWSELEARLMTWARLAHPDRRLYSVREPIEMLRDTHLVSQEMAESIQYLRRVRNDLVHNPDKLPADAVIRGTDMLRVVLGELGHIGAHGSL